MKVLWFSNSPANGDEILKEYGARGGWLKALDRALSGKVDLSVAFYYARFHEPFKHKGVSYYPICNKNWKFSIIKKSLFADFIDREDLPIYQDIINEVNPDVIHIQGSENPFGCIIDNVNVPVVLSIQGICTVYSHKYYVGIEKRFASFRDANLLSPQSWVFNKSFNYQFRSSFSKFPRIERRNLENCKYIIGRTDWDRRVTRIIAPDSIYFHNDEVLRDSFYQNEWQHSVNNHTVIHSTIGTGLFKGLETIYQCLNELNNVGRDIEWRVAGVSENSLVNKTVKRKIGMTYPCKGLILLGNLNEQELVQKMLGADIYVMPSHIENSPNSLCEAMILGMPCITTLAGGSSSLLKDKKEGLVIQDGDPWSMAGAIMELEQNPDMSLYYGRNARKRAMDRHNPEKIVAELLFIYRQILARNNHLH